MANNAPLLEQVTQNALLIDEGAADLFRASIEHIAAHEHSADFLGTAVSMASDDENFWPTTDNDWRASYRPYVVKDGILQIPIMGVLLNRFPWQLGRWATGYTYIEKALQRGLDDGNVKGIAFIHHSPGGEVAGCFELGDKIYDARNQKPMRAFSADAAYSASYLLYSSVGKRGSISRSGGVGSIGVVTAHVEYSEALKQEGIKVTFIFAGKHKVDGNAYEKLPESVKSRIQERINRIYGVFTAAVARNRSMDEAAVRATEALTYDASDAIGVGLADRVGSLEDEMVLFSTEVAAGEEQMANDATEKGIPQATHDKAVTDARAEGKAEGLKEGAAAATARIKAITSSDAAKTRPSAAMKLALNDKLSAVDADGIVEMLADMPEEKAAAPEKKDGEGDDKNKAKKDGEGKDKATRNHFDEAMGNGTGVEAGGEGDDDGEGDDAEKMSNSILADYAGAAGAKRKKQAA